MRSVAQQFADELEDVDGASDIISQEEEEHRKQVSKVGSLLNDKQHNNEINTSTEWTDPWSSDAWNDVPFWGDGMTVSSITTKSQKYSAVDTSFESLQFAPSLKTQGGNNDLFDMADAFGVPFGPVATAVSAIAPTEQDSFRMSMKKSTNTQGGGPIARPPPPIDTENFKVVSKVQVILKERLSILFDDSTAKDPVCRVVGSIYVQTPKQKLNSFCLTVRDKKAHIEHWDEQNSRCKNITASVPHLALDPGDQVFSISLKNREGLNGLDAPIMSYTCIPRLRPMPMLLKTKIHHKNNRCRLGIRLRANPQNTYVLENIVILIIVPFEMDGENVTMSREGGVWDDMKRTLIWSIPKLKSGEIVDIQAQFKSDEVHSKSAPGAGFESLKFPVLARCNGDANFSKINMNADYTEEGSNPVGLELERSATVLYRKV